MASKFILLRVEYNFFKHKILCDVWIYELKLAKDLLRMKLFAFCLNYNHFHLIIKPDNSIANYSKIMQFIKRNSSQNINKILGYTKFKTTIPYTNESDNAHYRLHYDDGSYNEYCIHYKLVNCDAYIQDLREKFINEYGENHNIPKLKWQKSFLDHVIRNKRDYENHFRYTMYNYLKHGLPKNWEYTGIKTNDLLD